MKGGLGKHEVFRVPDDEYAPIPPVNLGIQAGRYIYPAEGLFEGRPGARARFLVNGESGNSYGLTQLKPGDVVTIDAPGGGGYGGSFERDPKTVASDVMEGYVSVESAGRAIPSLCGVYLSNRSCVSMHRAEQRGNERSRATPKKTWMTGQICLPGAISMQGAPERSCACLFFRVICNFSFLVQ